MWKWMEVYTIYFECVTLTGLCKKAENRESCRKKLQLLRLSATNDRPCHVNYCFHRKITTFTVTILHWQLTHNKGRAYVTVPIKSCGFHSSLSLGVDLKVFGHHFGGDGVHVVFVLQELLHGLLTWLLPLVEVPIERWIQAIKEKITNRNKSTIYLNDMYFIIKQQYYWPSFLQHQKSIRNMKKYVIHWANTHISKVSQPPSQGRIFIQIATLTMGNYFTSWGRRCSDDRYPRNKNRTFKLSKRVYFKK